MSDLTDNTGAVKDELNNAILRALERVGGMAEAYAKQEVTQSVYATPAGWYARTGALRNSITHKVETDGGVARVIFGTNIQYAP